MFIFIYLFIYYFLLCWILVAARGIFCCGAWASLQLWRAGFLSLVVARRLQSAWAQQLWHVGLDAMQHVGFQFPNQVSNPHPLHLKVDSLPLHHQENPLTGISNPLTYLKLFLSFKFITTTVSLFVSFLILYYLKIHCLHLPFQPPLVYPCSLSVLNACHVYIITHFKSGLL